MEEIAWAKINLALHVRGREPDSYHRIETIFAFAEDGDRLRVGPGTELSLQVEGLFAEALGDSEENLVMRAARALRERFGVEGGATLTLDKRLPVAAGLGGGSADAAAALRLLPRWWGLDADEEVLLEIARTLGADVPACLRSEAALGKGRGDDLAPVDGSTFGGTPILLVNAGTPLSTKDVFDRWDGIDRGPLPLGPPLAAALAGRNDLEPPALLLDRDIGRVLAALATAPGATLVRMTGSGATCFALFRTEAERDAAASMIGRESPGWWRLATRLR